MEKWSEYHKKTKKVTARSNIVKFIENNSNFFGNAIDLGCGAGNDTIYLIKNNWNVLAIDGINVENLIREQLDEKENKKLKFEVQKFEELELTNCDLLLSNFALPFCGKEKFSEMWTKICNCINSDGYFVGNLFGKKDEWNIPNDKRIFFDKDEVMALFKDFEIIEFDEKKYVGQLASGKFKHWHIFEIVAKKKNIYI